MAQDEHGKLTPEIEEYVSQLTGVPVTFVHQVATFYGMFRFNNVGRYHIKVCESVTCHLMGATTVLEYLQKKLGIKVGETTPDGKFSLETVRCFGSCALAPVVVFDDEVYGNLTAAKTKEILDKFR